MERNLHEPEIYDFRQHDRLWQRVGPGLEPYPETTAEAMPRREELPPAQESQLPGAEPNPCCMGSEAMELLAVLEGYIEEELEDRRRYLALSRQAPSWARQTLRDMAEEENGQALPAQSGVRRVLPGPLGGGTAAKLPRGGVQRSELCPDGGQHCGRLPF